MKNGSCGGPRGEETAGRLDRNGYAASIVQRGRESLLGEIGGAERCYCCGRREGRGFLERLERHEPWGAANRQKSKALGLWVTVCRECHEEAHRDARAGRELRADAQRAAMLRYGWSRAEWIRRFGKSELGEAECMRIIRADAGRGEVEAAAKGARMIGQSAGGYRVVFDAPLPF